MKIKSLTKKALVVALLSGAAVAASAATQNLGAAVAGTPLPFNATVMPAGPFNDIFTFTLPTNGGSGYSVMSFNVMPYFHTALTTMSLVSNPDGILFNGDDAPVASAVTGNTQLLNLSWGALAAGSYYLNVTGITNGELGGLYNGAITVTAPATVAGAVPEPETYAMLLAGLGLMGFVARRRNKTA